MNYFQKIFLLILLFFVVGGIARATDFVCYKGMRIGYNNTPAFAFSAGLNYDNKFITATSSSIELRDIIDQMLTLKPKELYNYSYKQCAPDTILSAKVICDTKIQKCIPGRTQYLSIYECQKDQDDLYDGRGICFQNEADCLKFCQNKENEIPDDDPVDPGDKEVPIDGRPNKDYIAPPRITDLEWKAEGSTGLYYVLSASLHGDDKGKNFEYYFQYWPLRDPFQTHQTSTKGKNGEGIIRESIKIKSKEVSCFKVFARKKAGGKWAESEEMCFPTDPPLVVTEFYRAGEIKRPATVPLPPDMDLKNRIGQMLLVGFRGTTLPDSFKKTLKDINLGGVILFDYDVPSKSPNRNITNAIQVKKLILDLQANARTPLFISIDGEGGSVNRLSPSKGFASIPSAQKIGQEDNLEYTRKIAEAMAGQLSALGFNMNFAPVLDVNVNPKNPVIGALGRSYSSDWKEVVKHAKETALVYKENNIIAVGKHFPGHGSSASDSHLGLTDVTKTFKAYEFEPYRELIKSEALDAVMTAHILNQNYDKNFPATLSGEYVPKILRQNFKFNGLVISDDMQMGAIAKNYGFDEAIIRAINSGVEVLIFSNNIETYDADIARKAFDVIYQAVQSGKIPRQKIIDASNRIAQTKTDYGISKGIIEGYSVRFEASLWSKSKKPKDFDVWFEWGIEGHKPQATAKQNIKRTGSFFVKDIVIQNGKRYCFTPYAQRKGEPTPAAGSTLCFPNLPMGQTLRASNITDDSAKLNARIIMSDESIIDPDPKRNYWYYFKWGKKIDGLTQTTPKIYATGNQRTTKPYLITGLKNETDYCYQVFVGVTEDGRDIQNYGKIVCFRTNNPLCSNNKIDYGYGRLADVADMAKAVAEKVRISPALLLAEMAQETRMNRGTGTCYITGKNSDITWENEATHYIDVICPRLGLSYGSMPVSCPIPWLNSYGGAMGAYQFLPTTWEGNRRATINYRQAIFGKTGEPSPWNLCDAMTAAANKLSNDGADKLTWEGEVWATATYFGCTRWSSSLGRWLTPYELYWNCFYSRQVLAKKHCFQQYLNTGYLGSQCLQELDIYQ